MSLANIPSEELQRLIGMGQRVHKDRNHEICVAPRQDGGLWVHHVRLVPANYDSR